MIPYWFRRAVELVVKALFAIWPTYTDWTPTVTQGVGVSVTVTGAKYILIGKMCHIYCLLAVTGAGTSGSIIRIGGTPAAATPAVGAEGVTHGTCWVQDSGTANYIGLAGWPNDGSGWLMWNAIEAAAVTAGKIGSDPTPGFALASGDTVWLEANYRVA